MTRILILLASLFLVGPILADGGPLFLSGEWQVDHQIVKTGGNSSELTPYTLIVDLKQEGNSVVSTQVSERVTLNSIKCSLGHPMTVTGTVEGNSFKGTIRSKFLEGRFQLSGDHDRLSGTYTSSWSEGLCAGEMAGTVTAQKLVKEDWPEHGELPLTNENKGGLVGNYRLKEEIYGALGPSVFFLFGLDALNGEVFVLKRWRGKGLARGEWQYRRLDLVNFRRISTDEWGEGWNSTSLPGNGCGKDFHCFVADHQRTKARYFFQASNDYQEVRMAKVWNAGWNPVLGRLNRVAGETYETWLQKLAPSHSTSTTPSGEWQLSVVGTGFVVDNHFVVTADHVLRENIRGRVCNKVTVAYPYGSSVLKYEGEVYGLDPFNDLAVIKLSKPISSIADLGVIKLPKPIFAKLRAIPNFNLGEPVMHYGIQEHPDRRFRFPGKVVILQLHHILH